MSTKSAEISQKPGAAGGKNRHVPTEKDRGYVRTMAGYGMPQATIAHLRGIDPKTLRKHYRAELDLAADELNAKVAESLFRQAIGYTRRAAKVFVDPKTGTPQVFRWDEEVPPDTTAGIFWMKTRAGWKDKQAHEFSGPNGRPIEYSNVPDESSAREFVERELARIAARLSEVEGSQGPD